MEGDEDRFMFVHVCVGYVCSNYYQKIQSLEGLRLHYQNKCGSHFGKCIQFGSQDKRKQKGFHVIVEYTG